MQTTLGQIVELVRRRVKGRSVETRFYDLRNRFYDEVVGAAREFAHGDRTPFSLERRIQAAIRAHYPTAYVYGKMTLDPDAIGLTPDEIAMIENEYIVPEFGYLARWRDQLKEATGSAHKPLPEEVREEWAGKMVSRASQYVEALRALFFKGQTSQVSPLTQIWWNLWPPAEHCEDCPELAKGSPYTKDTLPTHPAQGDTKCLRNCKCFLTFGGPAEEVTLGRLAALAHDRVSGSDSHRWPAIRLLPLTRGGHILRLFHHFSYN